MKIKRSNKKILPLFVSAIAILSLIVGGLAPATEAKANKIMVTDHDESGTLSIGDEFCIGEECFYIIDNSNGNIRALTKYNINAGGDTYNVQNDPDYQNLSRVESMKIQMENGYTECNWDYVYNNGDYSYSATRCYKKYDTDIVYIDLSNREDLIGTDYSTMYSTVEAEYGKDVYDCAYDYVLVGEDDVFTPYFCYDLVVNDNEIYQDPEMLSAHSGPDGKLVFPMRGNVYIATDNFYDSENNLVLTEDYRNAYLNGWGNDNYNYFTTNSSVSSYIYKYAHELSEKYDIEDVNLLTYNDVMHILTEINPYGATFADDNYLIEDDETFVWEEQVFDEDDPHGYSYWFTSILDYVPEQYNWLYSTSYWLATSWINSSNYTMYEDDYGNEGFYHSANYQFFMNTQGNLCSISGYCGPMNIPSGIRPVITMSADLFELNTFFDINGTVRWIDNSDASKKRPEKSIIHLFRNSVEIDSVEVTKDENEDLWSFTFANLLKYDSEGNEYIYTVSQDDIPLYSSDITNFNIINNYGPTNPNTLDDVTIYCILCIVAFAATASGLYLKKSRR